MTQSPFLIIRPQNPGQVILQIPLYLSTSEKTESQGDWQGSQPLVTTRILSALKRPSQNFVHSGCRGLQQPNTDLEKLLVN